MLKRIASLALFQLQTTAAVATILNIATILSPLKIRRQEEASNNVHIALGNDTRDALISFLTVITVMHSTIIKTYSSHQILPVM